MKFHSISARLSKELKKDNEIHDALLKMSASQRRSKSAIVIMALEEHLKKEGFLK